MKYNNLRSELTLTVNEKAVLQKFVEAELDLYNQLNTSLALKTRQHPKGFIEMTRKLRVFGEVFEHNYNLRNILKEETIPDKLQVVKDDIMFLSEDALQVLDSANIQTSISPRMKRNMGVQMFRFYAEQARAFVGPGDSLKFAPTFLENIDLSRKRHVQLHRKTLIIEFNEQKNKTEVKLPYLSRRLEIDGNIKKNKWDIMIVHQQPGVNVSTSTPWYADFKRTSEDYILKYLDNANPNRSSAFNADRNSYRRRSF